MCVCVCREREESQTVHIQRGSEHTHIYISVCVRVYVYIGLGRRLPPAARRHRAGGWVAGGLAFTRYSFASRRLCTNHSSLYSPRLPTLPTLFQYYCTSIAQYTTPSTSLVYAIHHTISVMTVSCKDQPVGCLLSLALLLWAIRRQVYTCACVRVCV